MSKPQTPEIPGVGAVTDTLEFVKNLWGSMGVPGMNIPGITAPMLSVEDLDKKITDLKAVEAWLNVNLSMLRGTVQALEVQRATIATLKTMGESLAAASRQPQAAAPDAPKTSAGPAAKPGASTPDPTPAAWWDLLQDQFKQAVSSAMSPESMGGPAAEFGKAMANARGGATQPPEQQEPAKPKASPKPKPEKS